MLWFLLNPLRGRLQPPLLSADHPIRRAFYRHGKETAQHWLVAMLVSVAIAMAFIYPTVLSAGDPTAGYASLPHQVWVTARPYEGDLAQLDVEMRQVWIHGSHMRALDKDVLKRGLAIQHVLIGTGEILPGMSSAGDAAGSSRTSWGYHSPLMYWNNSAATIDADADVLRTINEQARRASSSLNVALRPASVFAGKKFHNQKLLAADALVITLMNSAHDGMGEQWRARMASLGAGNCMDCTLVPRDGDVIHNMAFELHFTPLSFKENILLTFAYSGMAIYVLLSLQKIKAFHSRFGLVVTAITQMMFSIMASITICGLLKINLSMIPQNAYPFVVLVIGLENMFRIINAVLAYPPTMATEIRIANALGDVGPVSVATAVQNLVILFTLSRVVSPGVSAFCIFAGIATLFDAFFLLTFFVAVLNVDIRRFELQDALARANQLKHRRRPSPTHHHSWFDALIQGRLPFSTRMAGTVVMTTFILALNYHFFEHKGKSPSLWQILGAVRDGPPSWVEFETLASGPINASLTPSQWMRMQDFDTAKEVMKLAKPGADSVNIRVFSPLLVVLPGSDRTDITTPQAWSFALRSLALLHFYPVAVAVVFAVAFVAVLMNFLLYAEVDGSQTEAEEEKLAVHTVSLPHKLDIIKLAGSEKGHLVSIGLDRTVTVTRCDQAQQRHHVLTLPPELLASIYWPVYEVAIDDSGEWIAMQCANGQILVFGCKFEAMVVKHVQHPDDGAPVLFGFYRLQSAESSSLYFLILSSNARLTMCSIETGETKTTRLLKDSILSAAILDVTGQSRRLVIVTDQAGFASFVWNGEAWGSTQTRLLPLHTRNGRCSGPVQISRYAEVGHELIVIVASRSIVLLDLQLLRMHGTFQIGTDQPNFSNILLGSTRKCPGCGQLAFRQLAIIRDASSRGVNDENDGVSITSFERRSDTANSSDSAALCANPSRPTCQSLEGSEVTTHRVTHPGAWSIASASKTISPTTTILGLRRREAPPPPAPSRTPTSELTSRGTPPPPSLRNRRPRRSISARFHHHSHHPSEGSSSSSPPFSPTDPEIWEAYRMSLEGEIDTLNVLPDTASEPPKGPTLYVSRAGPAVPLDAQSVAVAFGNEVKILRATTWLGASTAVENRAVLVARGGVVGGRKTR